MAGSYGHITDEDGKLLPIEKAADMLELPGQARDALECIEELYGMVHYLAYRLGVDHPMDGREHFIAKAREHYKDGIRFSGSEPWKNYGYV